MVKRIRKSNIIFLMLIAVVMFVGCTKTETIKVQRQELEKTVVFEDDLGRRVSVSNPKRVVTMIGSFTDIWYLAGGKVVAAGQDSWTAFNIALTEDVVNLGSLLEPNLEKLIAANPDFVIASSKLDSNLKLEELLEPAGITLAYFDVSGFDEYLEMLDVCTKITGKPENYKKYGTDIEKKIKSTLNRIDGSNPRILYMRATADNVKAKSSRGNVATEILDHLGCINIADSDKGILEELSMEAIVARDPEYIFVTALSENAETQLSNFLSTEAWNSLSAVQKGNYYVLDKNLYNVKPNARWAEAYEGLADIVYGEKDEN